MENTNNSNTYLGMKFLGNHSQSNTSNTPVLNMKVAQEQAFAFRVLNLPGVSIAILPKALEQKAREHYETTLKLRMPHIVVPRNALEEANLSVALKKDTAAHAEIYRLQQEE